MMKKIRGLNLVGMMAIFGMLQWSLYGCGGGGSGNSPDDPGRGETPPLQTYEDTVTGMEFILVEGGCFVMGDVFEVGFLDYGHDLAGIEHEMPVHEVCLDSFYMSKYPVTQHQWEILLGRDPSYFTTCDGDFCPVVWKSWNEIQEYLSELNQGSEKTFRLPTEAEWEYAARSEGKAEKYAGTSDDDKLGEYAWYLGNAMGQAHSVGQKKPNGLGLFDMSGNVSEWVNDRYGLYSEETKVNPIGPDSGEKRVIRSSSYTDMQIYARTSMRDYRGPDFKARDLGFRLVFSTN